MELLDVEPENFSQGAFVVEFKGANRQLSTNTFASFKDHLKMISKKKQECVNALKSFDDSKKLF